MKGFRVKSIDHEESLPEMIARARTRKGATIEEASRALNIQPHYLQAIEDGHLDILPGKVYAQKYLERYCRYLEVPLETIRVPLEQSLHEEWAHIPSEQGIKQAHLAVWPMRIRKMAMAAGMIAIGGYLAFALRARLQPPPLTLDYPHDGMLTHVASVNVSGQSEPEARLNVNGATVPVDTHGRFSISLNLKEGINYIRLSVSRRTGRARVMEIKIIRE